MLQSDPSSVRYDVGCRQVESRISDKEGGIIVDLRVATIDGRDITLGEAAVEEFKRCLCGQLLHGKE